MTEVSLNISQNDGFIQTATKANWVDVRDASSGQTVTQSGIGQTTLEIEATDTGGDALDVYIQRAFVKVDCSSIPNNATISAVDFKYSCSSIPDNTIALNLRRADWSDPLDIYDYSGNFNLDGSGFQDASYEASIGINTVPFNSSGVAYIQSILSTDSASLVLRDTTYDVGNSEPKNNQQYKIVIGSSYSQYIPRLVVTYTTPSVGCTSIGNVAIDTDSSTNQVYINTLDEDGSNVNYNTVCN